MGTEGWILERPLGHAARKAVRKALQSKPDTSQMEWRHRALGLLQLSCPHEKARAARTLAAELGAFGVETCGDQDRVELNRLWLVPAPEGLPGRSEKPKLVAPQALPKRSFHSVAGRAALMHAVAHIEMNAVNLALDAVWRFAGMPQAYYLDWLRIAGEEAHHFQLISSYLQSLGCAYGDFDAHNGLWDMVERTSDDVLARMALVPRTLEARGLDATPPMQRKLSAAGDAVAVTVLDVILRDEVGHVAVGNQWYRWLCAQRGLDPVSHYATLCEHYRAPKLKGPFNLEARSRAGFTQDELDQLQLARPSPAAP